MSDLLSLWTLGRIASVIILPSSVFLLWRAMSKGSDLKILHQEEKRTVEEKFLFVETDYVGIVLGRQLRNIRRIEYETRTIINLVSYGVNELRHNIAALRAYEDAESNCSNDEDMPPTNERVHFLRVHAQTKGQITLVELAFEGIMADARRRKNTDELQIPVESVGYVIGKGGDRIKRLSREFRVCARISQEGGEFETVQLEGTPEGIEGAKRRILDLVDYVSRQTGGEEMELNVDEQIKQMAELKDQLEEVEVMW